MSLEKTATYEVLSSVKWRGMGWAGRVAVVG